MKVDETLKKAYGHIPKETTVIIDTDWIPIFRGFRYYWIKFKRYFTR